MREEWLRVETVINKLIDVGLKTLYLYEFQTRYYPY